jgi:hypothetical protein
VLIGALITLAAYIEVGRGCFPNVTFCRQAPGFVGAAHIILKYSFSSCIGVLHTSLKKGAPLLFPTEIFFFLENYLTSYFIHL